MTIPSNLDTKVLTKGGENLVAALDLAATPGQIENVLVDEKSLPAIKSVAKSLGFTFSANVKKAELALEIRDAWISILPEPEAPKGKTAEEIMAEETGKTGNGSKKSKTPKDVDPDSLVLKARYADAYRIKAERMAAENVDPETVIVYCVGVRTEFPTAVCSHELEVYRWVEGGKVGHQTWNAYWHEAGRRIAAGEVEVEISVEEFLIDFVRDEEEQERFEAEQASRQAEAVDAG